MPENEAVDTTPLLAGSRGSGEGGMIKTAISDCKLQEQCFLSTGATSSSDAYRKVQRKLVIACVLCFIFMGVEVVGGYIAKSVAIMSDAAHMLSDVSAFLVSIFAAWAATQPSSWHYSFGYHRAEILGALVSVLTIWAVTGALVFEAVQRTINPVRVDGKLMFIISVAGVFFNILIALALGVHGHLGHSHGPGGCSGHGHDHGQQQEAHDHGNGACSGHGHKHGEGSKHSHSHSHGDEQAAGQHDHEHDHEHAHGSHSHSHGSCSDASSSSCAQGGSGSSSKQQANGAHAASCCGGGGHKHGGQAQQQPQKAAASPTPAPAAPAPASAASPGGEECIVINLPATASQGCGMAGHGLSCRCTISRRGSREIEVRYELPSPAVLVRPPGSAGGAAGAAGGVPGGKAARGGHSHAGECGGHGHGLSHGGGAGSGDINLRGAVLHVIGDLMQSIGVAIAGGLIWLNQDDPRWYIADPICTFVFSVVVLLTTKSILRDIVAVLMERTPHGVDVPALSQVMADMEGIQDVHDLHIWAISTSTSPVLTAHVHIGPDADANEVLQKLEQYVRGMGIDHSTIQICNPVQGGAQ